nr:hypothetical protein [Tanacetum cinerariifolium]
MVFNQVNSDQPPPAQYLVHNLLAVSRRHVATFYWTGASDVAATSAPVMTDQRRSTPLDHRFTVVDHRTTAADHGGERRSTVAVNDGRRWRTTVDFRWTTVGHHRTTSQRWLVGWSTSDMGRSGSGLGWV